METIKSYEKYNNRMALSMNDKLFFLDIIPIKKLVDFGCADGTMLHLVQESNPNIEVFGYDIDTTMIDRASKYANCFSDWENVKSVIDNNTTLSLSSVIHEIFSYCTPSELYNTFNNIFNSNFEYIVIRDMMPTSEIDTIKLDSSDIDKLYRFGNRESIDSFISYYGEIDTYRKLVHYLLKYRYLDNWEREVAENYLPINYVEFIKMIPRHYEIIYSDNFQLEFIYNTIKEDFGIELQCNTHSKIILKRKDV